jgi:hypothetical protein
MEPHDDAGIVPCRHGNAIGDYLPELFSISFAVLPGCLAASSSHLENENRQNRPELGRFSAEKRIGLLDQ